MYDARQDLDAGHRLRWSIAARVAPRRGPVLPKEPSADIVEPANRTAEPADGALFRTNSSTFGTLLSSQGSSAHFNPSLSAWLKGNLRNLPFRSGPVNLAVPGRQVVSHGAGRPSEPIGPALRPAALRRLRKPTGGPATVQIQSLQGIWALGQGQVSGGGAGPGRPARGPRPRRARGARRAPR